MNFVAHHFQVQFWGIDDWFVLFINSFPYLFRFLYYYFCCYFRKFNIIHSPKSNVFWNVSLKYSYWWYFKLYFLLTVVNFGDIWVEFTSPTAKKKIFLREFFPLIVFQLFKHFFQFYEKNPQLWGGDFDPSAILVLFRV